MATNVTLSQPASQEHKIITLKPDGTELSGFANGYIGASGFNTNTKGSIGELKQGQIEIELDYYGGEDWDDKDVFFNPGLFVTAFQPQPQNGQPNPGFKLHISPGMPAGEYPMTWYGCIGSDFLNRNYSCILVYDTNTSNIIIKHTFWTTYDTDDFISCTSQTNLRRLLRSKRLDPTDLFVDPSSVYGGTSKNYGYYIYVRDTVNNTNDHLYNYASVAFGMLNKSNSNGIPHFPSFDFLLSVNGISSGINLSHSHETKVRFIVSDQNNYNPTNAFAWLIRVDSGISGNINWLSTYDYSHAEILDDASNNTLHNAIKAPSTNLNNYGGNDWDITFHIDPNEIVMNARYRIIVVVYANPGDISPFENQFVNSYVSDELTAFHVPAYNPAECEQFVFNKQIVDYKNTFETDCIQTVPEDRLKIGGQLVYSGMDVYGPYGNGTMQDCLNERLGINMANNDPRKYLTKITVEIYEEYDLLGNTYKNIFDRKIITKTGTNTYSIPSGMEFYSLNWGESFWVWYTFRVRYEDHIACMERYVNGVLVPNPTGPGFVSQNWVNKCLFLKYTFEFTYSDYIPVIAETYNTYFRIGVEPYENEVDVPLLAFGDCGSFIPDVQYSTTLFDASIWPQYTDPCNQSPNVAFLQSIGELPAVIPLGLRLLFICDFPTESAKIYQWDGTQFVLDHEVDNVAGEIVCIDLNYNNGQPVAANVCYEFFGDKYTRVQVDQEEGVGSVENCDKIFLCKGDDVCIDVTLALENCEEFLAIATIDRPYYGLVNIQEEENESGNLEQLFSQHLELENIYFGDNPYKPCVAVVCIDSTNLVEGTLYKVSVLAKQSGVSLCKQFVLFDINGLTSSEPIANFFRFVLSISITQNSTATAKIFYLDNASKNFTIISTANSSSFSIDNDEHLYESGDGEVNILISWTDDTCLITEREFIVRIGFSAGTFFTIETIEITPGVHAEVTSYDTRIQSAGSALDIIEKEGVNYFRNYINIQRSLYIRYGLWMGPDIAAILVPFLYNVDQSGTPLGDATDTNNGFVDTDLTQYGSSFGILSDGTSWIGTGFICQDHPEYGLNDASFSAYIADTPGVPVFFPIQSTGISSNAFTPNWTGANGIAGLHQAAFTNIPLMGDGIIIVNRSASTVCDVYREGALFSALGSTSTNKDNVQFRIFGTPGSIYAGRIRGYFLGKSHDATQILRVTSAWKFLLAYTGKR